MAVIPGKKIVKPGITGITQFYWILAFGNYFFNPVICNLATHMTPRSNLPYNNAHAAANEAACARITADRGQTILPSSFDQLTRQGGVEVSRVDLTDLPPRGDHHVTLSD